MLEAVFSVQSWRMLCNESQLLLEQSLETAVGRVGDRCEMAAGLRGRERMSRGTSTEDTED
jgi:hypothetical protein